jgi:hypothetical protein
MEHRVPHDIGRDLAKKATVAAFASYKDKYGEYSPTTTWTAEYKAIVRFSVKGFSLDGTVDVRDREIAMELDVPFLLRPFKSRALQVIEREINLWCGKAKRGEI